MSYDKDNNVEGTRYSLFLVNLERWIDEIISRDGVADKELIKTVKDNFERAMQANITYYRYMEKNKKENGEQNMAERYRLMAEIYQSLLRK